MCCRGAPDLWGRAGRAKYDSIARTRSYPLRHSDWEEVRFRPEFFRSGDRRAASAADAECGGSVLADAGYIAPDLADRRCDRAAGHAAFLLRSVARRVREWPGRS